MDSFIKLIRYPNYYLVAVHNPCYKNNCKMYIDIHITACDKECKLNVNEVAKCLSKCLKNAAVVKTAIV